MVISFWKSETMIALLEVPVVSVVVEVPVVVLTEPSAIAFAFQDDVQNGLQVVVRLGSVHCDVQLRSDKFGYATRLHTIQFC